MHSVTRACISIEQNDPARYREEVSRVGTEEIGKPSIRSTSAEKSFVSRAPTDWSKTVFAVWVLRWTHEFLYLALDLSVERYIFSIAFIFATRRGHHCLPGSRKCETNDLKCFLVLTFVYDGESVLNMNDDLSPWIETWPVCLNPIANVSLHVRNLRGGSVLSLVIP